MSIINTVKTAVKNPVYRSVATYIFTNFFSKGVSFILIPLFTNPKYLTPTDNGLLSLFSSNMILLAPFISLGMIQSSAADYFKKSNRKYYKFMILQSDIKYLKNGTKLVLTEIIKSIPRLLA